MPLESTMICLDNSEWMRNGDYIPTRLAAQQDAASMLANHRLNDNPESTVGILTMAGQGVDLLVSPTEEAGKVLAAFAKVKIGGKSDLTTSIQIAQLALKHRKNKNGGQRIIVFLGGPISETPEALTKLAKQLKKNNVALDVILIGEEDSNASKVQELIDATNTNDNSHMIVVPAGVSPTNALQSSPLMHGAGAAATGAAGMGGGDDFDMYGGIDPTLDPELAMAIRISQEEARAHEEARAKAQSAPSSSSSAVPAGEEEEDEETLIQRALEMSMLDLATPAATAPAEPIAVAPAAPITEPQQPEGDDEDEELQRALALSMAGEAADFSDPSFANQLLGDAESDIQRALEQIHEQEEKESKDKDEKSKKRKSDDL